MAVLIKVPLSFCLSFVVFFSDLSCESAESFVCCGIESNASSAGSCGLFFDDANTMGGEDFSGDVYVFLSYAISFAVCFDDGCSAEQLCAVVVWGGVDLHKGLDDMQRCGAAVSGDVIVGVFEGLVLQEMVHRGVAVLCVV